MEALTVLINQPEEYDRAVHGDDRVPSLPSGELLQIITKDRATVGGSDGIPRGAAVLTFMCEADGKARRAQYSLPIRLLKQALRLIDAGYDDDGLPKPGTFGR